MVQELISKKTVAIIGGGPAGCFCAKILSDAGVDTTLFDKGNFLRTLLPTGGGRCNLAHSEFDYRNLAKNYPRGEKFLLSVFSKFGTEDTIEFFNNIGIKTYKQEDQRIFPISNSSLNVQKELLNSINCKFIKEKVLEITRNNNKFEIKSTQAKYKYDFVVVAIGGHSDFNILNSFNIDIIDPTPALVGYITKEDFSGISGVTIKNVTARINKTEYNGDILFTHKGVSGPLIYKLSSIYAREKFPIKIILKLASLKNLQELLDKNSHKEIKNIIGKVLPKSLVDFLLKSIDINPQTKGYQINGKMRDKIINTIENYEITVAGKIQEGEVVTCGGVNLKEVNSKTMGSKNIQNLYFCGEVLDIDGFCGGFNLQNCWSTGYVAATSIIESIKQQ